MPGSSLAILALASALAACGGAPPPAVETAFAVVDPTGPVEVLLMGQPEERRRVETALRAGPDGGDLLYRDASASELGARVEADVRAPPALLGRAYVDLSDAASVRLVVVYGRPGRVYYREVARPDGLTAVALESLVQLLGSTLEALRAGAEVGWEAAEARDELRERGVEVEPDPEPAELEWTVEAAYRLTLQSDGPLLRHGGLLGGRLALGRSGVRPLFALSVDAGFTRRRASDVRLDLLVVTPRIGVGLRVGDEPVHLDLLATGGVAVLRWDSVPLASDVQPEPTDADAEVLVGGEVSLGWAFAPPVELALTLGADSVLNPRSFVLDDQVAGTRVVLLRGWAARPSAGVRLRARF